MSIPYTHPVWCDPRCCVVVDDAPTCTVIEHRSTPMRFVPNADVDSAVAVGLLRRDEHDGGPNYYKGALQLVVTVNSDPGDGNIVSVESWLDPADARMLSALLDHQVGHHTAIGRMSPRVTS